MTNANDLLEPAVTKAAVQVLEPALLAMLKRVGQEAYDDSVLCTITANRRLAATEPFGPPDLDRLIREVCHSQWQSTKDRMQKFCDAHTRLQY